MVQTTLSFWRTLYNKMLAALEGGNFMRFSGYPPHKNLPAFYPL